MNCSEAERLFDPYLDGELSGSLRLEFDAHRLRCPLCQQKLAMMESCEHIIAGDSRAPHVNADFTDRVMAAVASKALEQQRRTRNRRVAVFSTLSLGAAAVLATFALVPSLHRPTSAADPARAMWLADVQKAIQDKDNVDLLDLTRKRFEAMRMAKSKISNDVGSVSSLPGKLVPREVADAARSLFDMLVAPILGPAESAGDADRETFSF